MLGHVAADIPLMFLGPKGADIYGSREEQMYRQELIEKGVDEKTASKAAKEKGIEARLTFGLTEIPMPRIIGALQRTVPRVAAKAGIGAGVFTGGDYVGGTLRADILEEAGYKEQAAKEREWDWMRLGGDLVMGALTGGMSSHPTRPRLLTDEDVLAAMHAVQTDSVIRDSAPGIPTDDHAAGVTADAMRKASEDLAKGQPVDVSSVEGLFDAHYLVYHSRNLEEARGFAAGHEKVRADYAKRIEATRKDVERFRKEGYPDEADHLETEVLPWLQRQHQSAEQLADQWADDVHRMENPNEHAEDLRAHQDAQTEMARKAEDMRRPESVEATPGVKATPEEQANAETMTNYAAEADKFMADAREYAGLPPEQAPLKYAGVTPEEQEILDLYQRLDQHVTGIQNAEHADAFRAELQDALSSHQRDIDDAGKFHEAALCDIGI